MESKCVDYDYEVSICKMEQQTKQVKVGIMNCVSRFLTLVPSTYSAIMERRKTTNRLS